MFNFDLIPFAGGGEDEEPDGCNGGCTGCGGCEGCVGCLGTSQYGRTSEQIVM